jgi:hypothetical protein
MLIVARPWTNDAPDVLGPVAGERSHGEVERIGQNCTSDGLLIVPPAPRAGSGV